MAILFVSGVNDRSEMGVSLDEQGHWVHLLDGNCSVLHRLPLKPGVGIEFVLFGKGVAQRKLQFQHLPTLIFNQIANPDTHRGALERCVELCDGLGVPVLNHPGRVLETAREQVAGRLQGIDGVIVPRTLRFRPRSPEAVLEFAAASEMPFPYLVRTAGEHHGRGMVRLDGPQSLAALHGLPLDGRDYYLVQYVDFQDEDGYYHKQRIVVVDGEPLLRHALYFETWIVHSESRAFMQTREDWAADFARFDRLSRDVLPGHCPAIRQIAERLGLNYFGIDCNLRPDGRMLVFEVNANMNVLHSANPETRHRVEAVHNALHKLLEKYSGEQVI